DAMANDDATPGMDATPIGDDAGSLADATPGADANPNDYDSDTIVDSGIAPKDAGAGADGAIADAGGGEEEGKCGCTTTPGPREGTGAGWLLRGIGALGLRPGRRRRDHRTPSGR